MRNIYVSPTDKPSRFHTWINNKGLRATLYEQPQIEAPNTAKNIYITSDEKIKEGDCVIIENFLLRNIKAIEIEIYLNAKKIILTTDQDLIKDGVQPIPDDFLEWFVKNPSCEEVAVEKYLSFGGGYQIFTPKEEPKPKLTNQKYLDKMKNDGIAEEFLKQETFEEVDGRKYNKEDLKTAFTKGHDSARMKNSYKSNGTFEEDWNEWFEQFKKK